MDQETANKHIHDFGALICLDTPELVEFGIDYHFWEVGPKFKGVKLIPIGIHYVFYSVRNKYGGDSSPRTSFFINVKRNDVIVRRWDPEIEEFVSVGEEEAQRYAQGFRNMDFDSNLGAYPVENYHRWKRLTSFITKDTLDRLLPIGGTIDSSSMPLSEKEKKLIGNLYEPQNLRRSYFVDIPKRFTPSGVDPSKVAQMNFDRSHQFEWIIEKEFKGNYDEFLAEMQYAFVCFLLGQSFESFDHWKKILSLVLNCEQSVTEEKNTKFFISFLECLKNQLKEITEQFLSDVVTEHNFLHYLLSGFFELTDGDDVPEELRKTSMKLKKFVEKRFKVKFSLDEFDEYAPTVV